MTTTAPPWTSGTVTATPATVRRRPRVTPGRVGRLALLLVAAFLTLGPVVWTVYVALTPVEPGTGDTRPGLSAFVDVFAQIDVLLLPWNSVLVTALAAIAQMFTAALAGYVFARHSFRGSGLMFGGVLATMMVPLHVTIVPVFLVVRGLGIADTLLALIVPAATTAFDTFLMRQQFLQMPAELGEAAEVDGAGPFRVFFSVYLPLGVPGMAIVGILAFNGIWNEFFRPLIMLLSEENFTLPLCLLSLQGRLGTGSMSTVLAGAVISMIPALLVFVFGQRSLREGQMGGSHR